MDFDDIEYVLSLNNEESNELVEDLLEDYLNLDYDIQCLVDDYVRKN